MSYQARERRSRRGQRVLVSLLSLLVLFGLLGAYVYQDATTERVGKLAVIETSQVTISVGGAEPAPPPPPSEPQPGATAAPSGVRGAGGGAVRPGGLVTEVLGASEQAAAQAVAGPNISTSGPQAGSAPASGSAAAAPTPASSSGTGTGLAPSGGSGTGGGGSADGPFDLELPRPTATSAPAGPSPTPAPSQPFDPGDATPFGHNSHLRMDGVVGPGAYTTGGVIVSNVGPVAFNYSLSMSTAGDAAFASVIRMRIYLRVGPSCNYPGPPPSPSAGFLPLTGDQVGTVLFDGAFSSGNKFGDPSVELAAGDRFLDIGQSEVLCMEAFFPWTAGNQHQGKSVNGTFIFTAKSPDE